ncbi:hypothetical protein ACO0LC_09685 [Undibacterium sp. JH2W]|uniref:hypothetical protein n=1 Tax=Undibacterium sp. JH2W TaxID=3413037 RepID=UPI003BF088F5
MNMNIAMIKRNTLMLSMGLFFSQSIYAIGILDGVAKIFPGKTPLLFTTGVLSKSDEVQLEFFGKDGKEQCCTKAFIEKEIRVGPDDFVTDAMEHRDMHVYGLKLSKSLAYPDPFIGIAVIGKNVNVQAKGAQYLITDEKLTSTVSTCYSQEGMHVIRREGKKKLSHFYIPLGYDVEPTCPKKM